MKKNKLKRIMAVFLAACMLSGCGMSEFSDLFRGGDDSDAFFYAGGRGNRC